MKKLKHPIFDKNMQNIKYCYKKDIYEMLGGVCRFNH